MQETDKVFAGSVPENYDRYMVPLIFAQYAADIARRAASLSPRAVLEIAAGTGAVTRALAPGLSSDARYVVTDLNQPMLDFAALRQGVDSRITWRQADALALPFEDASFDLVCCQFGAMFFPDRVSAYREAKRVLKPGGHFLFNVWDRIEENVFADDVTNALAGMFPGDPPRFMARTPHGYHDKARIRDDVEAAGFSAVEIETRAEQSRASSAYIPAVAYCQGTLLRNEIEARDPGKLAAATDYVASVIANRHGSGEVAAKIQAHVIMAAIWLNELVAQAAWGKSNFTAGQVDAAFRYGPGHSPAAAAERIMNEMVSPVGAPDYRARMCGLAAIKDLGRCQTIHQIGWEHDMGATSQAQ